MIMNKLKYSILILLFFSNIVFSYKIFSNGLYFKDFIENKIKYSREIKIVTYSIDETITKSLLSKNHHIIADSSGVKTKDKLNIQKVTAPNTGIQHEKFYIFDDESVIFGTGNMTYSGIIGDKNIFVYTEDKEIVNVFKKEFYNLSSKKYKPSLEKKLNNTEIGDFSFYSTPNNKIYKVIQKEIRKAKNKIDIFAFSLTDPFLVYEIEKAASKDIEINLYFDDWNIYYSEAVNHLKGINKVSYDDLHAKIIILDEKRIILGSYNFTYKARNTNYELLTIVDNKAISEIVKSMLIEEEIIK
ncbi:MAG: phospholipase D-like domain-containing protein [Thermotogota bacterium]